MVLKYLIGEDNSPDNLTPPISVELHAALHKDLFEHFGNTQDEIAWKCLSGISLKGIEFTPEICKKISDAVREEQRLHPRKHSKQTKRKMSEASKGKEKSEIHIINIKKALGSPIKIDGIKFVSHNDAALYAIQKYHMSRNTALRKIKKGIKDFSIFENKYHNEYPYTAKKLEKWHTYK